MFFTVDRSYFIVMDNTDDSTAMRISERPEYFFLDSDEDVRCRCFWEFFSFSQYLRQSINDNIFCGDLKVLNIILKVAELYTST